MEHVIRPTDKHKEPDWFRIGRDAVRVMDRLSGMRELDFYLRHPEPFIRLHAIRRVAALLLSEAVPALAKRLEDPLENEQNRDEAGWAIRRICRAREIPWFANTPWTDRYDGTERASDRFGVRLAESGDATAGKPAPRLPDMAAEDEVLLRIQMEESEISLSFSVIPWFLRNARFLLLEAGKAIVSALLLLLRSGWRLLQLLIRSLAVGITRLKTRKKQTPPVNPPPVENPAPPLTQALTGTRAPLVLIGAEEAGVPLTIGHGATGSVCGDTHPIPPASPSGIRTQTEQVPSPRTQALSDSIATLRAGRHNSPSRYRPHRHGKGGKSMFRLLFYPVRLVKTHWVFTLVVLIAFYALLGFTLPGRRFVYRVNPGAQVANDRMVALVRTQAAHFLGITGTQTPSAVPEDETQPEGTTDGSAQPVVAATVLDASGLSPTSRVTAPKGLNLRKTPSAGGEKIVWMKLGEKVDLNGKTQVDADGALWQNVTYQGQTGWAMDKWLDPAEEGAEHAGS
jgi:hypothetical protein